VYSTLRFCPEESLIFKTYSRTTPNSGISIHVSGIPEMWSPCLFTCEGHNGPIRAVAVCPHNSHIASGSDDMTIRIWSAATGALVGGALKGHSDGVTSVAFSPDGKQVASGSRDKTICLWDVLSGKLILGPLEGHNLPVTSIVFWPDGGCVVSASLELVLSWDTSTGDMIGKVKFDASNRLIAITWSSNLLQIVTWGADHTLRFFDGVHREQVVEDLRPSVIVSTPRPLHDICFSPSGKEIWSTSFSPSDTFVSQFSRSSRRSDVRLGYSKETNCVASLSPESGIFALGSYEGRIQLREVAGSPLGVPLEGHNGGIVSLAFSADGGRLVSGSTDDTVRVWDTLAIMSRVPLSSPRDGSNETISFSLLSGGFETSPLALTMIEASFRQVADGILVSGLG
jgi:WD40 repeat protein